MTRVTHVISGLNTGGAEIMLYRLLSRMDRSSFEADVVSLTDVGPVGKKIRALGIAVRALGMQRGVPNPLGVSKLGRWFREGRPDVVQTWMYHANLVGALATRRAGGIPLSWGIHNSTLDPRTAKPTTIWTAKACARLSKSMPARIVCVSDECRRVHAAMGYAADKMVVIPNGFDLDVFKPDPAARLSIRRELGVSDESVLIGIFGRFDPQKDHFTFVQAATRLGARAPDAQFVLCGDGVDWENPELAGWIEASGIKGRFHLLGPRDDVPDVMAGLDIVAVTSYVEAFSLVTGEAMACGVPCVVTDVGATLLMVDDTGRVVPVRNARALAEAWAELAEMGSEKRKELGTAARRRIQEHFNLADTAAKYEALYEELAAQHGI